MFPADFTFQNQGFRIAGSPVGTDAFMREFVDTKLMQCLSKLQAISSLGTRSARATHRLLTTCGTKLLNFLAATVPPHITEDAFRKYDQHVDAAFFKALSPSIDCSEERRKRAELKICLPAPWGCGLFRTSDQGKVAYLSSVAGCLSDPVLFRLRPALARYVNPAWSTLVAALGGVHSRSWPEVSEVLPSTADAFLDGSMYSPDNDYKIKLSKVVLKVLSQKRVAEFQSLTAPDKIGTSLTKGDVLRSHAQTLAARIFSMSLKHDQPFVNNNQYISWCLAFLGLPPANTLGNASGQEGYDYPAQRCMARHRGSTHFLDVDGAHAAGFCPASHAGRLQKHRNLAHVLAKAAKEAGLRVTLEPDTHSLLLGEFSKFECRRIFPRRANKNYKEKFKEVLDALDLIASPSCVLDEAAKCALVQAKIDALPSTPDDLTGLRIDVAVENELTGETKWIDVTVAHTGAESYQEKELKSVVNKRLSGHLSSSLSMSDPLVHASPTLLDRTNAKIEKYSRLILVAKKQVKEKKRKHLPVFSAFALSDYGELAPAAVELQEWLVAQYRTKCEATPRRDDGLKPLDLVRDYRFRLQMGVQLALAAGFGEMCFQAGRVWG